MSMVNFDIVATIQATSPLLSSMDLDVAIEQFEREGADSLLTGVVVKRFFWSLDARPLNYDPFHRPFSQQFQGSLMENGAFYLTRKSILERFRNRLGGITAVYQMAEETATEMDIPSDWERVERLLVRRSEVMAAKAGVIKLIISDFDGVWTDNKVYTFGNGQEGICCGKSDSLRWDSFRREFGIPILVVSKEKSEVVRTRCAKLGLPVLHSVDDKCATIERELAARGLSWAEVCYIGNDLNDLQCIRSANLTFCPSDAAFEVRCAVDYVLAHPGGNGAIREMLDLFTKVL
jgi:N-acylneuraminate cytidylyltransferase